MSVEVQEYGPSRFEQVLGQLVEVHLPGHPPTQVWHRPFFETVEVPAAGADAAVASLTAAVEAVLAQDPSTLPEPAALARATALLALQSRLHAAVLAAVADVDARELFTGAHAGSSRSWLRQTTGGDPSWLTPARRLAARPRVAEALARGAIDARAAEVLTAGLERVPDDAQDDQLVGVLQHGVPDTLDVAHGGTLTSGERTASQQQLADELARVVAAALTDSTATPADRLEPAFVLLAGALPVEHLRPALDRLLDALQPDALRERERQDHDARSVRLVKKRFEPGWRFEAHLTDDEGLALQHDLARELAAEDARAATLARLAAQAAAGEPDAPPAEGDAARADTDADTQADADTDDDTDDDIDTGSDGDGADSGVDLQGDTGMAGDPLDLGSTGPGTPAPPPQPWDLLAPRDDDRPVDGGSPRTEDQRRYDAFVRLLSRARASGRGSPTPAPASVTVTCTVAALEGRAGVLPGSLQLGRDSTSLSPGALRRLACGGLLSAVLLDAAGTPVGASSSRRHATERERRALRARQGDLCLTNACPNPWTVPHHVEPFWRSRHTALHDLVGICPGCHHDVHDGHRTLRLRDGRLLDENGWVER